MTDREWELVAPFVPPAKRGGRRRTTDMREVINAILCIAASGGAWRMLPKCFPPVSTVRRYFYAWRDAGLTGAGHRPSAGLGAVELVPINGSSTQFSLRNLPFRIVRNPCHFRAYLAPRPG
jgi:hypothetical protein